MLVLVTGGARSGKSSFAESYTAHLGKRGIYIATAQAYDGEMRARIGMHRQQRELTSYAWTTIEEPLALAETLISLGSLLNENLLNENLANENLPSDDSGNRMGGIEGDPVILVDCLTLWLSNWLLKVEQEVDAEERLMLKIDELVAACKAFTRQGRHLLLVTNEVGYGLVPEYKLGRQFRDLSGVMNKQLANAAEQVFLVTSGIPVELTRMRYQF
ncbi:bifunctional adenosylcobinamide kinase/adenosylcobinamide-phosphate guanylyltransferase [Paenibacillus agricola]|uniref:Adenosylcobinamide kinase n=1 Tax=Paenibacillus agricola TaxID=2716264 RepID=A0ABX0J1F2_9BACL|nr:bifunctional adenosylcobinamide kinase/adenosylcobinamide-phosphate guanylyltransferase [Paenibacillus agricola]NHN29266.1 bifunctional adenosylcobinamide kinase/adenosylcobinamide-phosphate guanylyltransferase [Paenibacillus agricola]